MTSFSENRPMVDQDLSFVYVSPEGEVFLPHGVTLEEYWHFMANKAPGGQFGGDVIETASFGNSSPIGEKFILDKVSAIIDIMMKTWKSHKDVGSWLMAVLLEYILAHAYSNHQTTNEPSFLAILKRIADYQLNAFMANIIPAFAKAKAYLQDSHIVKFIVRLFRLIARMRELLGRSGRDYLALHHVIDSFFLDIDFAGFNALRKNGQLDNVERNSFGSKGSSGIAFIKTLYRVLIYTNDDSSDTLAKECVSIYTEDILTGTPGVGVDQTGLGTTIQGHLETFTSSLISLCPAFEGIALGPINFFLYPSVIGAIFTLIVTAASNARERPPDIGRNMEGFPGPIINPKDYTVGDRLTHNLICLYDIFGHEFMLDGTLNEFGFKGDSITVCEKAMASLIPPSHELLLPERGGPDAADAFLYKIEVQLVEVIDVIEVYADDPAVLLHYYNKLHRKISDYLNQLKDYSMYGTYWGVLGPNLNECYTLIKKRVARMEKIIAEKHSFDDIKGERVAKYVNYVKDHPRNTKVELDNGRIISTVSLLNKGAAFVGLIHRLKQESDRDNNGFPRMWALIKMITTLDHGQIAKRIDFERNLVQDHTIGNRGYGIGASAGGGVAAVSDYINTASHVALLPMTLVAVSIGSVMALWLG